jgi:hypothetical protein
MAYICKQQDVGVSFDLYPLKAKMVTLLKAQVFIPSSYAMQNLVIYYLGVKLHEFVKKMYIFCV